MMHHPDIGTIRASYRPDNAAPMPEEPPGFFDPVGAPASLAPRKFTLEPFETICFRVARGMACKAPHSASRRWRVLWRIAVV